MTSNSRAPVRVYLLTSLLTLAPYGSALAHAQLRSAEPPVDGTVHEGEQEIRITYSEAIDPRFCQVAITGPGGKPVAAAEPSVDPDDHKVLIVHFGHPLAPEAYKVTWHATLTDTHKAQGQYSLTVAP